MKKGTKLILFDENLPKRLGHVVTFERPNIWNKIWVKDDKGKELVVRTNKVRIQESYQPLEGILPGINSLTQGLF